ncbi:8705_t:CDS:2, partial [Diversispora eburnea]
MLQISSTILPLHEDYKKPIRSAEFLSSTIYPPPSDKVTFSVEEYEIFKVTNK